MAKPAGGGGSLALSQSETRSLGNQTVRKGHGQCRPEEGESICRGLESQPGPRYASITAATVAGHHAKVGTTSPRQPTEAGATFLPLPQLGSKTQGREVGGGD